MQNGEKRVEALGVAQERGWLLDQLLPNHPALYVAHAVRRTRAVSQRALSEALAQLAARHPGLRARFVAEGERPALHPAPRPMVSCRTAGSVQPLEEALANEARADAQRGLDLSAGPVLRATQVITQDGSGLVLIAHRAVVCRAQLEQLTYELSDLLDGTPRGGVDAPELAVRAEREFLASPRADALASAIKERLRGHELSLDLATDRPRTEHRTLTSALYRAALPARFTEAAAKLAQAAGARPEDAITAALALALARYARQRDLLLGEALPPAERGSLAHRERLAVLRVQLEGTPSVIDAVQRVRDARKLAHAEAELPFEALIERLSPKRDPSRAPIFQVELRHHEANDAACFVHSGGQELDLSFEFVRTSGGLACHVTFATELFEPSTVARMVNHTAALLERMAAQPEAQAFRLPLVTDQEREALLAGAQATHSYSGAPPIHRWVEARAQERPEQLAVRCDGQALTYDELNRRANRLARALKERGVTHDVRVLVCMERTVDLIVALLGVLKAGGAYVPIEPTNPVDRIAFVLEDAKAPLALTQRHLLDKVAGAPQVVLVDELEGLAHYPDDNLDLQDDPASLAYVIYTSGSTGKPKGCLLEHRQVVRLFQATYDWFGFDHHDVFTMFHSVAFDWSVFEIWGALMHGASLVVVPQTVTRAPEDFVTLCAREGVTVLCQTPSAFRQFIPAEAPLASGTLALRLVIFGGEALELESLRPWFEKHGDERPELVNMYGITETTVHVTYRPIRLADLSLGASSVIGVPIPDLYIHLLDEEQNLVPVGVPGEIYVGGAGVARGYLERPELTAQRFMEDPFFPGKRLYRSGDLARWLPDGDLDYLGRLDFQVKIRGFRIETGEIEAVLRRSGLVRDVAVIAHKDAREAFLAAYVVSDAKPNELRQAVRKELPEYMVPAVFVRVAEIPLNVNGKVDRRALPEPREESTSDEPVAKPSGELEQIIASVWCEVLGRSEVGVDQSFFDLGGNSARVVAVAKRLKEAHGIDVPVARLFQHITVRTLAEHLNAASQGPSPRSRATAPKARGGDKLEPIAIVGVAGRFPGAGDAHTLWKNLRAGLEAVKRFSPEELDPSIPEEQRTAPNYVPARPVLEDATCFDAEFFGISPSEAEVTDPQQRVMLEVAWEALEDAGYDPSRVPGAVGVFCGEYNVTYYANNVLTRPDAIERVGPFIAMVGNEKDFIATRIAHRLNLHGPAISVHTACSTSLVAVAQAFSALRNHECDMALAGGASITFPQAQGHLYEEGGMLCADGHCRPFDANATGTMFGDGAAMVVLKRLSDAEAAGDHIYAVIRGAATNNDGGVKMSFSAPTVEGQAQVIEKAQAIAEVSPESISYVEAHGTATPLGDPIEVEALTQAFRAGTDKRNYCALGSVKSNIGHLTAASGAAGLIKTALALHHEELPKSLHFERPNPRIDFANSPFYVLAEPKPWPRTDTPRRAGVSSFGVGGTNAHVVVEEAPRPKARKERPGPALLVLTARNEAALARASERLAAYLGEHPELPLNDVAFTLACGRKHFEHRRAVVASDLAEASAALARPAPSKPAARSAPELVFVFPGQGSQHAGMGRALYQTFPAFRAALDRCAAVLRPLLGTDLCALMFAPDDDPSAHALLRETRITQPAIFAMEYALSQLWASFGVRPTRMIGHSVGEFVAAHLAGVMSLEDALSLVAERGRLLQSMPRGAMLSVRAPAEHLAQTLDPSLSIAAINAPNLCVVAGPESAVDALSALLEAEGVATSRLHTSHAFHSGMMDPAVAPFAEHVRRVKLAAPKIPILSTVTGKPLSDAEATSTDYWARHLRATVRFADAVSAAFAMPGSLLLEVGPRNGATQLARQCATDREKHVALSSLDGKTDRAELAALLSAVGQLFERGVGVELAALFDTDARRVPLPGYPFERKRYFLEPGRGVQPGAASAAAKAPQPAGAEGPVPADEATSSGEALVASQLRLMQMQLDILQGRGLPDA